MIADQYLDTHLWDLLWSRVSQSLKPDETSSENANAISENQSEEDLFSTLSNPDWTLLSPSGYLSLLQLASRMLTMSPQNCTALIMKEENVMFDTISYMLSEKFLFNLKKAYDAKYGGNLVVSESLRATKNAPLSNRKLDEADVEIENDDTGECLVGDFIIIISQLLCFPFAIDANEEIISNTYKIIKEFNLFNKIVTDCILYASNLVCDIPVGLIARLILTDDDLVQLMVDQLNNSAKVRNLEYLTPFICLYLKKIVKMSLIKYSIASLKF